MPAATSCQNALDTVHVDAEVARLDLTWRAQVSVHERIVELESVMIDATGGLHA